MALEYDPIICKSCARVLATASSTGLVSAVMDTEGCDTCQRFSVLHDEVQAADSRWAEMESKRDTLKAKQTARANYMRLHMEFDNWLIGVEASRTQMQDKVMDLQLKERQEMPDVREGECREQNMKRARSHSSTSQEAEQPTKRHDGKGFEALQQHRASLSYRPSSKRTQSSASLSERKRLKFSDSVEFRDDYRVSSEFLRNDERYVRGRHAAPDGSEYLDTSGSGQTFLKFTGERKVKGTWVEAVEKVVRTGGEELQASTTAGKETLEDAAEQVMFGDGKPNSENATGETQLDARTHRSVRRSRRTSGAASTGASAPNEASAKSNAPGGLRMGDRFLSLGNVRGRSNNTKFNLSTPEASGESAKSSSQAVDTGDLQPEEEKNADQTGQGDRGAPFANVLIDELFQEARSNMALAGEASPVVNAELEHGTIGVHAESRVNGERTSTESNFTT